MDAPTRSQFRVSRLLAAGALVHLLSTASVYALGRFGIVPNIVLPSGVLRGLPDGINYLEQSVALGQNLSRLSSGDEQIHVRLYAVSSAVLTPIVGANILSIELINLSFYLLGLFLIYKVGQTCFEPRTGFAAAITVGLFPTLLLHETQPLRDPLFIVLMLAFLWITIRLLTKPINLNSALTYAAGGCLTLILIWLVRDNLWLVYVGLVTLALVALVAASIKTRHASLPNFACLLFFLLALFLIPKIFFTSLPPKERITAEQQQALDEFTSRQVQGGLRGVFLKVSVMRQGFVIFYKDAGSNIDVNRTFRNAADVVVYLPRAVMIGLFAPFPDYWFKEGKIFGRLGRVIAGLETSFIYLLSAFALAGVWRFRRSVQTWYLLAVVLIGAAALGLVVVNLGALYRLRYFFWIVLIILSASYLPRSVSLSRAISFIARSKEQSG